MPVSKNRRKKSRNNLNKTKTFATRKAARRFINRNMVKVIYGGKSSQPELVEAMAKAIDRLNLA